LTGLLSKIPVSHVLELLAISMNKSKLSHFVLSTPVLIYGGNIMFRWIFYMVIFIISLIVLSGSQYWLKGCNGTDNTIHPYHCPQAGISSVRFTNIFIEIWWDNGREVIFGGQFFAEMHCPDFHLFVWSEMLMDLWNVVRFLKINLCVIILVMVVVAWLLVLFHFNFSFPQRVTETHHAHLWYDVLNCSRTYARTHTLNPTRTYHWFTSHTDMLIIAGTMSAFRWHTDWLIDICIVYGLRSRWSID